jgi:lantibiotic modifying enzyme
LNSSSHIPISFCNGIAGIGWLMAYLKKEQCIDYDIEDILGQFDTILQNSFHNAVNNKNYDFLHGTLGYALFFLQKAEPKTFYDRIITYVEEISIENDKGLKWLSENFYNDKSLFVYNLSLSHGSASIVAILIKIFEHVQSEKNAAKKIITEAINYILSQQTDVLKHGSFFPSFIIKECPTVFIKSRLAWCYGDLGIGVSMWRAGQMFNNDKWNDKAMDILLYAANNRRNLEDNNVFDCGFCHGTAGIAHIFYRMWKYTQIVYFKDAADFWINKTVEMFKVSDFKMSDNSEINMGLITGLSGIGLVLTSYLHDVSPNWDEVFLLS